MHAAGILIGLVLFGPQSPITVQHQPRAIFRYQSSLLRASALIDAARAARTAGAPNIHLPPLPSDGPPRFSPSLDEWLQAALRAVGRQRHAKDRAAALADIASSLRFVARDASHVLPGHAPAHDPRETARAILAAREYRIAKSAAPAKRQPTLWQQFWSWVGRRLYALFAVLAKMESSSSLAGTVLAILLLGLSGLAFGVFFYRLARALLRVPNLFKPEADQGDLMGASPDPEQLHASAEQAGRQGQYARAVGLIFYAGLLRLDRAGAVTFDPARTAGEYRREVRRGGRASAAAFDVLARIFSIAAYADKSVNESDWSAARLAYRELRVAAPSR